MYHPTGNILIFGTWTHSGLLGLLLAKNNSVLIVIYTCKIDVCKKNEEGIDVLIICDDERDNVNECGCKDKHYMRQYLSLFISDCQEI